MERERERNLSFLHSFFVCHLVFCLQLFFVHSASLLPSLPLFFFVIHQFVRSFVPLIVHSFIHSFSQSVSQSIIQSIGHSFNQSSLSIFHTHLSLSLSPSVSLCLSHLSLVSLPLVALSFFFLSLSLSLSLFPSFFLITRRSPFYLGLWLSLTFLSILFFYLLLSSFLNLSFIFCFSLFPPFPFLFSLSHIYIYIHFFLSIPFSLNFFCSPRLSPVSFCVFRVFFGFCVVSVLHVLLFFALFVFSLSLRPEGSYLRFQFQPLIPLPVLFHQQLTQSLLSLVVKITHWLQNATFAFGKWKTGLEMDPMVGPTPKP